MNYQIEIRVTPREGIVDPEGHTIGQALANLGYEGVHDVQAGRLVRFDLEATDREGAEQSVIKMCEQLIANPVIERYAIDIRPSDA